MNPAAKIMLKRLLKEWQADGTLERKRGALHPIGQLPPVVVADILGRDADGDFVAVPAEWPADRGEPPRIVIPCPVEGVSMARRPASMTGADAGRAGGR